jgi:hypothetical protein
LQRCNSHKLEKGHPRIKFSPAVEFLHFLFYAASAALERFNATHTLGDTPLLDGDPVPVCLSFPEGMAAVPPVKDPKTPPKVRARCGLDGDANEGWDAQAQAAWGGNSGALPDSLEELLTSSQAVPSQPSRLGDAGGAPSATDALLLTALRGLTAASVPARHNNSNSKGPSQVCRVEKQRGGDTNRD